MNIELRRARREDYLTLMGYEIDLFRQSPFLFRTTEQRLLNISDCLDDVLNPKILSYNMVVAEVAGGIVGYVLYDTLSKDGAAFIHGLFVNSHFRRNDIGGRLVDVVMKEAKYKGMCDVVVTQPFDSALGFYEKLGFEASNRYGKKSLVMKLQGEH